MQASTHFAPVAEDDTYTAVPSEEEPQSEDDEDDANEFSITSAALSQWGMLGVIIANTMVMALEATYIRNADLKPLFKVLEIMFLSLYILDIGYKVWLSSWIDYLFGSERAWNIFDIAVTAAGAVGLLLTSGLGPTSGWSASVARLFQVLRIFRLARAGRFVRDLDYVCIIAAIATLKLVGVVFIVIFVFGLVSTNLLWDSAEANTASLFMDLGQSMWTLFKVMTLDGWVEALEPAMDTSVMVKLYIIVFIFCGAISLMSLVPALFVQLNLDADKRLEEKRKAAAHNALLDKDRALLDVAWSVICTNGESEGTIHVSSAQAMLADPDKVRLIERAATECFGKAASERSQQCSGKRRLEPSGAASTVSWTRSELRDLLKDVQLALFSAQAEHGGVDIKLDRHGLIQFLTCRHSTDPKLLWRCLIEARRELQLVGSELRKQHEQNRRGEEDMRAAAEVQQTQMGQDLTTAIAERAALRETLASAATERADGFAFLGQEISTALRALQTAFAERTMALELALDAKIGEAAAAGARAEELSRAFGAACEIGAGMMQERAAVAGVPPLEAALPAANCADVLRRSSQAPPASADKPSRQASESAGSIAPANTSLSRQSSGQLRGAGRHTSRERVRSKAAVAR